MISTSERTEASPDSGMSPRRAEGEAGYPPPPSVSDEYLLRELVYKHSDRLQRFIMKHIGNATEAEELAQQAFVEAAAAYKCFRGQSQLSSWLYGIALNLVRNYLSRAPERRHAFVSDTVLETQTSADLSPEDQAAQNQTMALLHESVNELPDNMREILLLVGLDELSYEEAAALLTVPIGTVRSRLFRARALLRDKLRQKGITLDH